MSVIQPPHVSADDRVPVHPVLWLVLAVMAGFELMFAVQDAGWLPEGFSRDAVFYRFAFYDILFDYWRGIVRINFFDGPPPDTLRLHSFLTHAFLHGGWMHLLLNGVVFLALGHALVRALGILRFLVIFAVCAVAGALAFGLIAVVNGPMIGASGAIFGMFAVVTAWQERFLRLSGVPRGPIWRRIGALAAINVVAHFALQGMLAWEAHLGGWVAGWILASAFRPRFGPLSRVPLRPGETRAAAHRADRPGAQRPEPVPPPRS